MKKIILCLFVCVISFTPNVHSQEVLTKKDTTYFHHNDINYSKAATSYGWEIQNIDDKYHGDNITRLKIIPQDSTDKYSSSKHPILRRQLESDFTLILYDYIKNNFNTLEKKALLEDARKAFKFDCSTFIGKDASLVFAKWRVSSLDIIKENDIAKLDIIMREKLIIKEKSGLHEKSPQVFYLHIFNKPLIEFLEKELQEK